MQDLHVTTPRQGGGWRHTEPTHSFNSTMAANCTGTTYCIHLGAYFLTNECGSSICGSQLAVPSTDGVGAVHSTGSVRAFCITSFEIKLDDCTKSFKSDENQCWRRFNATEIKRRPIRLQCTTTAIWCTVNPTTAGRHKT